MSHEIALREEVDDGVQVSFGGGLMNDLPVYLVDCRQKIAGRSRTPKSVWAEIFAEFVEHVTADEVAPVEQENQTSFYVGDIIERMG